MLKFLPLLVVLTVSLAREDDTRDLDEIIWQLQQRAASTTTTTTTSTATPITTTITTTTKPIGVLDKTSTMDEIIRQLQQQAASATTATTATTTTTSTTAKPIATGVLDKTSTMDEIIRQLQQQAASATTATTATTTTTSTTAKPIDVVETCVTENDEQGECVPYYQCSNGSVSVDGGGLLDFRASACSSSLDVCCLTPASPALPPTPALPPDGVRPVQPVRPIEGCGWRNKVGEMNGAESRVAGSTGETEFGEFPWMVAIFKVVASSKLNGLPQGIYSGGGSLIHPSVVLTAAHIVWNSSAAELQVRAGEWDMRTRDEPHPHQDRDVAAVVVHPDFIRRNLFNDVALLFLREPVADAPHVGVVCLPRAGAPAPAGPCLASGWGKDRFGPGGTYHTVLKSVEVPVVDHQRCTELLRSTRLGRHFMLHDSFMCAGERDRDTCTGDGGSPLVCPSQDARRWVQHGVVSWGVGCGSSPGVYAAAGGVRAWLDREVAARGLDPRVYTLD